MKRFLTAILALCMILCMLPVTALALEDTESNNTFATAQEFTICDTIDGSITDSDYDWYKFTLDASGSVSLNMRSYMRYYTLSLYDSDANRLWYTDDNAWDASVGMRSDSYSFDLTEGTYYIKISGEQYLGSFTKSTGTYTLKTDYVNANATETEENDTIAQANDLPLNSSVNGQIAMNDQYDFFRVELPEHGKLTLDMTARDLEFYTLALYDVDGKQLWYDDDNRADASSNVRHDTYSIDLLAGTYTIGISGFQYLNGFLNDTGTYTLAADFVSANTNEPEPNNTTASALEAALNRPLPGQIALNDQYDFFRFTLQRDMELTVNFTSYMQYYSLQLYNASGDRVWYDDNNKWDASTMSRHDLHTVTLTQGTYSIAVSGELYAGDSYWRSTGSYILKLNTPNPFTDVPADSFYIDPVLWAVENGITSGTTPTTFSPSDSCMRAHVVTFLWRAAGCPEPKSAVNPFTDVKTSDFFYKPVLWAVENGITTGTSATTFSPTGVCNRAQVVTFLYRAFGSPEVATAGLPFADVPAGAWYEAPIAWAVVNGITNGLSATEFGPNASCNRAQVVTFLYRAYND